VVDAEVLEVAEGVEEVVAEAAEEVEGQTAVLAEPAGECGFTRPVHEEAGVSAEVEHVALRLDDERVIELAQGFEFGAESLGVLGLEGELKDEVAAVLFDEERGRCAAGAESLLDDEVAGEALALPGFERVGDEGLGGGGGPLVFDFVEKVEEFVGGTDAEGDVGVRGFADEELQAFGGGVEDGGQREPAVLREEVVELVEVGRGRLVSEDEERDRAEGEDVHRFGARVGVVDGLGREIDGGGRLEELAGIDGEGASGGAGEFAASLPVEDAQAGLVVGCRDEDALGAEGSVDDAAAVSVAEGIGDLAHKVEARIEGQSGAVLPEVEVEASLAGLVLEEERGSEFVIGVAGDFEDAGVLEAAEDFVFARSGGFDDALVGSLGVVVDATRRRSVLIVVWFAEKSCQAPSGPSPRRSWNW
jgi:hypothetical protein